MSPLFLACLLCPRAPLLAQTTEPLSPPQYESGRFRYEPLTWAGGDWYGSPYWTGPDWTRVGKTWHHSGENVGSVRVFVAPETGTIRASGRVYKLDTKGGDGVRAAIRLGDRTLWTAEIEATDGDGVSHDVTVEVHRGDAIRFVLTKRGTITCDTTFWDPTVAYASGAKYHASEGFSDQPGAWRYEMESDTGPNAWRTRQWLLSEEEGLLKAERGTSERPEEVIRFQGLRAEATYLVTDANGSDETRRTGEDLMRAGLPLALPYGGSVLLRYRAGNGGLTSAPPPPPRDLVAAPAGKDAVELSWSPVPEARSYVVYRDGDAIARVRGATHLRDVVLPGERSRYAVSAERGFLRSETANAVAGDATSRPELGLWEMVEAEWAEQDHLGDTPDAYPAAAARALASARALLERLRAENGGTFLTSEAEELEHLSQLPAPRDRAEQRVRYLQARWLKRQIALANPLLSRVGRATPRPEPVEGSPVPILFAKRVPTSYSHLVMQYFGWRARPGGGLYVLERPGESLAARDLLQGRLGNGSVLAPCLSWDAKRVVFSCSRCAEDDPYFHVFEVGIDGSGLRQLTTGPYEDLMPAYLPEGGIIFSSTRRRGYARCFGAQFGDQWHVYTLHRMDADGGNLRTLSFHETNEWFPSVLHDGSIMYARWDYVDRHAVLHQNLWRTNPDGTSPATLYGNQTEDPHCCFEAQPIPHSNKLIATASAHHSVTGGSIILIDPNVDYDGPAPLTRVTPDVCFPEAEGWPQSYYATPWPLSEDYYLVSYSPKPLIAEPNPNDPAALGLYLLDRWGDRELLYRDPTIGSTSPLLLAPRPMPPIVPSALPKDAPDTGSFLLLDVYQGLPGVERGSVKALRLLQILPKATPVGDVPPIGLAGQEPGRLVLGTVPVEPDGSAHFTAPARKPLLFQALDERGLAIQTMRSLTYLQPGERASCVGCHERRNTTPAAASALAGSRAPSVIAPGPDGCAPFSYPRLVQPVLDRYCISCHGAEKPAGGVCLAGAVEGQWTRSYLALTGGRTFWQGDTNPATAAQALVPRFGGWNSVHSTPVGGLYGSRGSRLMRMLLAGHHDVQLDPESLRRLAIWIDANAVFYGTFDPAEQAKQLRGELIPVPSLQ